MKDGKKVVDLIYVEAQKDEATVIKDYTFSLEYWKGSLKTLQELYFEKHFDSASPDVLEVLNMRKFLGKFLQSRLEWISNIDDESLRRKYLKVLPPFPQKGGIKTLLLHFFQVTETKDKKELVYQDKGNGEKEISILWDIYKLRRTIKSIDTILKSLDKPDPFPSIMSVENRKKCLVSLRTAFQLMFQMCIQRDHQKNLYRNISSQHISPEAILERREKGVSFVYPHVIKKFDYRNHFFYIYYYPGMKAKIGGELKTFHYNYLDFEIIKQEFLMDWMNHRLKDNPQKQEIYGRYSMGGKTLAEIVQENPPKEIEILQQLPLNVFNDITAEVNEEVSQELKTEVESFSENKGEFAETAKNFEKAKKVSKFSLKKLKQLVVKNQAEPPPAETVVADPEPEPEKPTFEVVKIKKNQIDFPFFMKETVNYKQKMNILRVKMGPSYPEFSKKLSDFFTNVSESSYIKRRTPKHEVIYPCLVKENRGPTTTNHLLILGAEVKAKQLGMGYGPTGSNLHAYTCFFVYGCEQSNPEMGNVQDKRNARGIEFQIYDFTNSHVQQKALELFKLVMEKG
ncbi:MAG: hypothetical protein GY866_37095 [Proteobacteria bacterium]|nr:hypothetical protein [Pseudomonadota bacterium]